MAKEDLIEFKTSPAISIGATLNLQPPTADVIITSLTYSDAIEVYDNADLTNPIFADTGANVQQTSLIVNNSSYYVIKNVGTHSQVIKANGIYIS